VILFLFACVDQGFTEVALDAIAVVQGDFDDVQEALTRNDVGSLDYNGYIDQATWWPEEDDRPQRGDPGRSVEQLLTDVDEDLDWQIENYNAVFFNSGTRGLNAYRYNLSVEADDSLLVDEDAVPNVCNWVKGGGSLYVGDWSYDLVEACWPDAIEFYGDDGAVDAAQVGRAGDVQADVPDERLRDDLQASVANLVFNYSAFAVIESVGSDVEVLLTGDVQYQPEGATLYEEIDDAPLAVRFVAGNGQVFFSSFHLVAQTPAVTDAILFRGLEGLESGAGSQSAEVESE